MPAFSLGTMGTFALTLNGDQTATGAKVFLSGSVNSTPLRALGMVGQSSSLFAATNSDGDNVFTVANSGTLSINGSSTTTGSTTIVATTPYGYLQMKNATAYASIAAGAIISRIYSSATNSAGLTPGFAEMRANFGSGVDGAEEGYLTFLTSQAGALLTPVRIGDSTMSQVYVNTLAAARKGLILRGMASQSANLQEWQTNTGAILGYVDGLGNIKATALGAGGFVPVNATLHATPTPGAIGLVIRPTAATSANLAEFHNPAGTVRTRIGYDGALGVNIAGEGNAWLAVSGNAASDTLFMIKMLAGHTGNPLEIRDSTNVVRFRISPAGSIVGRFWTGSAEVADREVFVGAPDSGGTGYRMLRVTN